MFLKQSSFQNVNRRKCLFIKIACFLSLSVLAFRVDGQTVTDLGDGTYVAKFESATTTTWHPADGATVLKIEAWGGGGGGGNAPYVAASSRCGSGGGGGAYAAYNTPITGLTAASVFDITVGAGGGAAANGQNSLVTFSGTTYVNAGGGKAGVTAKGGGSSIAGGDGGVVLAGDGFNGGKGGTASITASALYWQQQFRSGGGGGAAGSTGPGADASANVAGTGSSVGGGNGAQGISVSGSNSNGNNGSTYGGGGSGATHVFVSVGSTHRGGSGAPGAVWITYTLLQLDATVSGVASTVCPGADVELTASAINFVGTPSYAWYAGSTLVGTGATIMVNPSETTTYNVVVTADNGTITKSTTVSVFPAFDAGAISNLTQNRCVGTGANQEVAELTAPSGGDGLYAYQWQLNGVDIPDSDSPAYLPAQTEPGQYVFSRLVKDGTCASWQNSANTATLAIHAVPTATVSVESMACHNGTGSLEVTATGGTPSYFVELPGGAVVDFPSDATTVTLNDITPGDWSFVVKDLNNCAATTNTVTLTANDALAISGCPANIELEADYGEVYTTVTWVEPTFAPSAHNAHWTISGVRADNHYPVGVNTITYTATNDCGEEQTCSFTITVTPGPDVVDPCIGCTPSAPDPFDPSAGVSCSSIGNQTVSTDWNEVTYTHSNNAWNVTANDNVGVTSLTYALTGATTSITVSNETLNGQVFNMGTTTVTWTAMDAAGHVATCSFDVTVEDQQAPTITCPADPTGITCIDLVPAACADYAAFTAAGGVATDNVGIIESTFRYTEVSDGNACPETFTRTYFISDAAGNENYCEQVIVVNDDVKPTFTVPADVTLCRTATGAEDLSTALAGDVTDEADNCTPAAGLDATYTTSLVSGTDASDKVYTRTWTLVDNCGNETTADQTITVRPSILTPGNYEMTCPEDKNEVLLYNLCEMYVNLGVPTTVNNMIGMDVVVTNDAPAGYIFPEGTTIVTWTATDECGASISCTQTVVVNFPPCGTDANADATDANGNVYSTVRIGCQCWLAENLRSTNYMQDGAPVAVANDYNDDPANAEIYGKLYSWYSANKIAEGDDEAVPATKVGPTGDYVQGVCPQGWALPTDEQYHILYTVVGTTDKLKEAESAYWLPGKGGVAPTSGFDARGAGYYDSSIERYINLLGDTYYWTSSITTHVVKGHCSVITHVCPELLNQEQDKGRGHSVRCLRME